MRWEKNEWNIHNVMGEQSDPLDAYKREFQPELKEDPESMLYVLLVLMYMLSLIFLSFHLFDLSTTCAAAQSMLWFVFIQWVALAFRTSPVAFTNVDFIALCTRDLVHHTLVHVILCSLHSCEQTLSACSLQCRL